MTEIDIQVAPDAVDERDIAIRVESVSKCYQVYGRPEDRLKQSIMPRLQRLAGRAPRAYYKEFWALRDVSLEIRRGETVGIIGRNGSGKSTLLQTICGTLTPTSGSIDVDGRVAALLELGAGFNPEFTGRENVYMSGAVLGLSREQVDQRFDDIVAFADIGDFIEQPVKTYSSGMYVRLAFAVIAHADADILVIDEALSVGDVFFGQKCMRFLRDFMKRGTVIFVSHDTSAVINLCERVVWMQGGQVRREGATKEVIAEYLEDLYYEDQAHDLDAATSSTLSAYAVPAMAPRDMRQDLFDSSTLRNDIEVFAFNLESSGFGTGSARIIDVAVNDRDGRPLSWAVGGQPVTMAITCQANEDIHSPIIGFEMRDRLGQVIFAENTYLTTRSHPVPAMSGQVLKAVFEFRMPILRSGDYTFTAAVAEGTQEEHVQHHWLHEAMAIHVHASPICLGLMGVPMQDIRMDVVEVASGQNCNEI